MTNNFGSLFQSKTINAIINSRSCGFINFFAINYIRNTSFSLLYPKMFFTFRNYKNYYLSKMNAFVQPTYILQRFFGFLILSFIILSVSYKNFFFAIKGKNNIVNRHVL